MVLYLEADIVAQTLAIDALSSIRCVHCHNETIRPGATYLTDLVYQPLVRILYHNKGVI